MGTTPAHFRDLFFSTGTIPSGSVREYFTEVSHGLLTLTGEVVGPYRLPRTLAAYAGGQSGTVFITYDDGSVVQAPLAFRDWFFDDPGA